LLELARNAARIRCTTPGGTEFEAEFSSKLKWLKTSGIIQKDKWGNLPGGEILTSPLNTQGVFVVDGVVGDYLCARYGDLKDTPLTIEVENNRIRFVKSENKDLRDDFRAYTQTDENSNRVGEFAIGTNTACTHVGNILQDEKFQVFILRLRSHSEHTGANGLPNAHRLRGA
jgi:leucyl aminopeptidase (aminopeptidase T)